MKQTKSGIVKPRGLKVIAAALLTPFSWLPAAAEALLPLEVPIIQRPKCTNSYLVNGLKSGYLNIRSGPGKDYRVIGALRSGTEVDIVDCKGKWLGIQDPSGEQVGWVYGKYLTGARK